MQLSLWFEIEKDPQQFRQEMEVLLESIAASVAQSVAIPVAGKSYHIILTSQEYIRQLNLDFRLKDSVTDVLSFPLGNDDEITGEIYICWAKIISQAEEYGHPWQREFSYLLVHGILHLLGYEHGDAANPEMREMEEKILGNMGMGR